MCVCVCACVRACVRVCVCGRLTHLGLDLAGEVKKVHVLEGNGKVDSVDVQLLHARKKIDSLW